MFKKVDYAIVYVSDMNRSIRFYRDVLGFRPRFESPFWTEFETEGTTLALHSGVSPSADSARAQDKQAGTVGLGLSVSNLDATFRMLQQQGVNFLMEPTLRADEGIRLAIFTDPDGMPISLAEPVRQ